MPMPVTWNITTQQESARPDVTGRFVQGMLVGFQTSNGLTGTIFVPDTQYNPAQVKQMIADRVKQMTDIQNLQSGP